MTFNPLFHHTDKVFVISRHCGLLDIFECDTYAKIRSVLGELPRDDGKPPYEFLPVLVEEIGNMVPICLGLTDLGWWTRTGTISKHNYGVYEYDGFKGLYYIVLAFNTEEAQRLLLTEPEVCSMALDEKDIFRLGKKR